MNNNKIEVESFSEIFYKEPLEKPGDHPYNGDYMPEISQDVYKKEYVEALIKQNTYLQEKIFELQMEVDDLRYNTGAF